MATIDKSGPQFVIDQLCANVESAAVAARASTGDASIKACMDETGIRVFCVERAGQVVRALSADAAVDALGAMT